MNYTVILLQLLVMVSPGTHLSQKSQVPVQTTNESQLKKKKKKNKSEMGKAWAFM